MRFGGEASRGTSGALTLAAPPQTRLLRKTPRPPPRRMPAAARPPFRGARTRARRRRRARRRGAAASAPTARRAWTRSRSACGRPCSGAVARRRRYCSSTRRRRAAQRCRWRRARAASPTSASAPVRRCRPGGASKKKDSGSLAASALFLVRFFATCKTHDARHAAKPLLISEWMPVIRVDAAHVPLGLGGARSQRRAGAGQHELRTAQAGRFRGGRGAQAGGRQSGRAGSHAPAGRRPG